MLRFISNFKFFLIKEENVPFFCLWIFKLAQFNEIVLWNANVIWIASAVRMQIMQIQGCIAHGAKVEKWAAAMRFEHSRETRDMI